LGQNLPGIRRFLANCAINLSECIDQPDQLDSARKVFERRIRYRQCRPMDEDPSAVVSPCDSRLLLGSLKETSKLFLKGKFFDYEELLRTDKSSWLDGFRGGDFVICRLTPEKYHYNHTPVAGIVTDFYEHDGDYHSCNPGLVISLATPYSKNKRVVTVIDTDVSGGTRVGWVAMIEVVALMVGDIVQCYSAAAYEKSRPAEIGMFVERGCPKSLFRPGSSTTVLLFQKDRVEFSQDSFATCIAPTLRAGTRTVSADLCSKPKSRFALRSLIVDLHGKKARLQTKWPLAFGKRTEARAKLLTLLAVR
jgi:phosphatidylserine decarboxylase